MNAYFQHINASGGINGRKVQFIYRDDQYSPAKTPAVVRELVEKEQVFAIVGGIGTANGRAVADYLEQQGVPFFTPASGDRFWSEGGKKNVYTVFPKYVNEGEILGELLGQGAQGEEGRGPVPGRRLRQAGARRDKEGRSARIRARRSWSRSAASRSTPT